MHLLYIDLHEFIRLNSLTQFQLFFLRRCTVIEAKVIFIQDLVVELYLVLQALAATVEIIDPFLFGAVDRDLGLLRFESPTLLVVEQLSGLFGLSVGATQG